MIVLRFRIEVPEKITQEHDQAIMPALHWLEYSARFQILFKNANEIYKGKSVKESAALEKFCLPN